MEKPGKLYHRWVFDVNGHRRSGGLFSVLFFPPLKW